MKKIYVTEKEIIQYCLGDKSSTLNMALAFEMPYIAEKAARTSNDAEKALLAVELLSKCNNEITTQFLSKIIYNYDTANSVVLGVSLLTIAENTKNDSAVEYLKIYGAEKQGTKEEANKIINIFNNTTEVSKDEMLNFVIAESVKVKKYNK